MTDSIKTTGGDMIGKTKAKLSLWNTYTRKNTHWPTAGARLTAKGVRDLVYRTFDVGFEAGFEAGLKAAKDAEGRKNQDSFSSRLFPDLFGGGDNY